MQDPKYKKAKKKVKKLKDFYSNLSMWILMSIVFIFINLTYSPQFLWCVFPIAGWGFGVLFQGLEVYGVPGISKEWEQRKIREEMKKLESDPEDEDYLELKDEIEMEEFKKLRKEWDDSDFV